MTPTPTTIPCRLGRSPTLPFWGWDVPWALKSHLEVEIAMRPMKWMLCASAVGALFGVLAGAAQARKVIEEYEAWKKAPKPKKR